MVHPVDPKISPGSAETAAFWDPIELRHFQAECGITSRQEFGVQLENLFIKIGLAEFVLV